MPCLFINRCVVWQLLMQKDKVKHLSLLQPELLGREKQGGRGGSCRSRCLGSPFTSATRWCVTCLLAVGRSKDPSCHCVCHIATPIGECASLGSLLRDQLSKPLFCPEAGGDGKECAPSWPLFFLVVTITFLVGAVCGVFLGRGWSRPADESVGGGLATACQDGGDRRRGGVFLDAMRLQGAGEVRRAR